MKTNQIIIETCRIYEPPETKDGLWFLVDRLWPRGLKKDKLPFDAWLKEIAPSSELRKWFNHDPARWQDFSSRYIDQLSHNPTLIEEVIKKANQSKIILFYAAKNKQYNHAKIIKAFIESWPKTPEINQFSKHSR
tara:strand:- start:208 stop:612 length:405 start_codon:yes stop_codon:yes gene_type:complete